MKIGDLDLGHKLLLAPMAEITDSSFRKICKEHGAGLSFTQMVSAKGIIESDFHALRLMSFSRDEKPVGIQLLGSDPGYLREAVSELRKYKPDMIDINSGCPIGKVTKHNFGACLLDDKILLGKIVKEMVDASGGIPISVKIRLGRDKNNINILENARTIEENGASLLIVHTRTRVQKYYESCDWSWLKKISEVINIPLVGNGNVFTHLDAKRMIDETGCDSIMVARGSLGNPFLFERFNSLMEKGIDSGGPDVIKIRDTALKHLDLIVRDFGEFKGLGNAKKHIVWYFRGIDGISNMLDTIFSIKEMNKLRQYVIDHTDDVMNNRFEKENFDEINKKFLIKVLFWLPDVDLNVLS